MCFSIGTKTFPTLQLLLHKKEKRAILFFHISIKYIAKSAVSVKFCTAFINHEQKLYSSQDQLKISLTKKYSVATKNKPAIFFTIFDPEVSLSISKNNFDVLKTTIDLEFGSN